MRFHAENVTITNGAAGILLNPTVGTGSIRAMLHNVRVWNNTGNGIRIENLQSATGVTLAMDASVVSSHTNGFSINSLNNTRPIVVMLANSPVAFNTSAGITASGGGAVVRVGDTTITGNGFGVSRALGAVINTYGNNRLNGNAPDGLFTAPAIAEQ